MGKRSWIESRFEAEGLECVVLALDMGHRCGYVKVPDDHPWFGLRYWDGTDGHRQPIKTERPFIGTPDHEHPDYDRERECVEDVLVIHGGVTFDGERPNEDCESGWWFGFDCAHLGDARDPELISARHRKLFGDDLTPSSYGESVKSLQYVEAECRSLAAQLAAVAERTTA